jgi:transposase
MAKPEKKQEAFRLHREGVGIKEIAMCLNVSRGSVGMWVRDLELTRSQQSALREKQIAAGLSGRLKGAESNKQKRLDTVRHAQIIAEERITSLSKEALFYLGLGLYWGEGSKTSTSGLGVTNSDFRVIQIMTRWFSECFSIEPERFQPRVFISDTHRDREEIITSFWEDSLGIPRN